MTTPEPLQPTSADAPADTPIEQRIIAALGGQSEPVYAIVDTARSPETLWHMNSFGGNCMALLQTPPGNQLAAVSPYLVRIEPGSQFLTNLVYRGWGQSWGVYLTATSPIAQVGAHLRALLLPRTESGKRFFFRYYDPRVLRVFLPTCSDQQTGCFFGPVSAYICEGDNPSEMLEFSRNAPPGHASGFVLTNEQVMMFEREAAEEFIVKAEEALEEDWPEECEALGEEGLRRRVKTGFVKARRYGITEENDILRFLNLQFVWSEDFDTSPSTPWAGSVLNRQIAGKDKMHLLLYASQQELARADEGM